MKIFFSDLHLSADRPESTRLFIDCLEKASEEAVSVFILGDLFDFWAGDDDNRIPGNDVKIALKRLTSKGIELYVAPGNRDFLLGSKFALQTGAIMLPDYQVIRVNKERTLITHGDILCTRDKSYQRFRKIVRNKLAQKLFLSMPISVRLKVASDTQNQTVKSVKKKAEEIMDVDPNTVQNLMQKTKTTLLIHGHTHRPKIHNLEVLKEKRRRVVLGDWYESNYYVFVSRQDEQKLMLANKYLEYFKT
ncbi:MAG: UDP-2,3-diacylglucosamine diphosphatase [Pseudomonadota bacterium]|nr:UDP-2,3-diacylglucosamine diphosphatase [Pseudomonadota bacterium]